MGCSFESPAGAAVIRFRSLYAPQNLNLERLLEKPRSVNNEWKEEQFREADIDWQC